MRPYSWFHLKHRVFAAVLMAAVVALFAGRDVALANASLMVDATGDTDSRDGVVTLREAILLATGDLLVSSLDAGEADNVTGSPGVASADTIVFSAAVFPEGSPQEIALGSGLPPLDTGNDTIDGTGAGVSVTSQSGTDTCLTLGSTPSGATGDANVVRGLEVYGCGTGIHAYSDENVIDGVVMHSSGIGIALESGGSGNHIEASFIGTDAAGSLGIGNQTGIESGGGSTVIGGPNAGDGNIISGNTGFGIHGTVGSSVLVQNNFIGTASDGETAVGNGGTGIRLRNENPNNWTIVGNIISGNGDSGIELEESTGHVIRANKIGVTASGAPLGNGGDGILKAAYRGPVTIGGSAPGDANIIGANVGHGVSINATSSGSSPVHILGNYIGVTEGGSPVPNGLSGVYLKSEDVNVGGPGTGEGNVIAGNGRYGVEFGSDPDVSENYVRGNSIYGNALGGILIPPGATLQDVGAPVITAVGSASGTACAGCTIDVYSDDGDQGRRYEGFAVANGAGNWSYMGIVHGPYVTATASEYAAAGAKGTSEFSTAFPFDTDVDGSPNSAEAACGADMEDPGSIPERVDGVFAGVDDDGNDGVDEALPAGAEDFDCDGDGYIGSAEAHVFGGVGGQDQDACGPDGWPSDFVSGGIPDSTNRINILDFASFAAPVRYFGTNVGTNPGDVRWDISPGKGPFSADINMLDLAVMTAPMAVTGAPPMLGGVRAFNGPVCPWAP